MSNFISLPLGLALALLLAGWPLAAAAQSPPQPELAPTRDVDITYVLTRPHEPRFRERVRWRAAEHLERIDGPDRSTTIVDRGNGEITLVMPASRTYRKLDAVPRQPVEPERNAVLHRGGEAVVAGERCVEWSWVEDAETRILCVTADGVALRLIVGGKTVVEARSVSYRPQSAELFKVPPGYAPALAPEGGGNP